MQTWTVILVAACYLTILFAIAWWGDQGRMRPKPWFAVGTYALTLAIYNTSWSFYGSVGRASTAGFDFFPIYLGPILLLVFFWPVIGRIIAISKAQNATSISDFIAARYGKSQTLAAFVTLSSLVAVLPYIALQLKAVGSSFDVLTAQNPLYPVETRFEADTPFAVAVIMAIFSIIFGVRHIHAREHHRGLMIAIAFESLVKLACFLSVGLFICFGMFDGFADLVERAGHDPGMDHLIHPHPMQAAWLANSVTAIFAFLCLPQAFHVAIVENEDQRHVRHAAWLYPGYLLLISLFMVPVAVAGRLSFAAMINPDTYMITLPVAAGHGLWSLVAFIGGLSAATGMIIVATVALSTMICNDVVLPILLRFGAIGAQTDMVGLLLLVRRVAVFAILFLAYLMFRLIGRDYPLMQIGLISFVAVAQFGPALLGALYWQRANGLAALSGMSVGFVVWFYTLLLPSAAPFFGWVPTRLLGLNPYDLLGIGGIDPTSHATFWSLGLNAVLFVLISCLSGQSAVERSQARAFATVAPAVGRNHRALTLIDDLRALALRFAGPDHGADSFDAYIRARRRRDEMPVEGGLADLEDVRFTETLVAGAIGAASARVVMAAALQGPALSKQAARAMLDEASDALHFNRTLLQATLESLNQGVCVVDRTLKIVAWNSRLVDRLDLPPLLLRVGLPLADLVAFNAARGEYGPADLAALIINRDRSSLTFPYVYERQRPDGTVLEITYNRMQDGGFVATFADVTERHRAARALQAANEGLERRVAERTHDLLQAKAAAEAANVSKTRFLAAASHDLLQPLSAARLFVATMEEALHHGPVDRAAMAGLAERAALSLRSTEELLDGLMDISALDSGAIEPNPRVISVGDLLEQLATEFTALAAQRGLALTFVACRKAILIDPPLLRRILQNLLANALRYTPSGRVLIGCRAAGSMLRVEVWDTGIGIEPAKHGEIFEEFRRLAPSQNSADRGLGLGLAIVERIARLMGCRITVRSWPGRGSCFAVTVPRAAAAVGGPQSPAMPEMMGEAGLAILCLDNEGPILAGMAALLGAWGHGVHTATDVAGACALTGMGRPDLIIVDYHLDGGITGLQALEQMRAFWGVPVRGLLITADRSAAIKAQAMQAGVELLLKPVKPAALRRYLVGISMIRNDAPASLAGAA